MQRRRAFICGGSGRIKCWPLCCHRILIEYIFFVEDKGFFFSATYEIDFCNLSAPSGNLSCASWLAPSAWTMDSPLLFLHEALGPFKIRFDGYPEKKSTCFLLRLVPVRWEMLAWPLVANGGSFPREFAFGTTALGNKVECGAKIFMNRNLCQKLMKHVDKNEL